MGFSCQSCKRSIQPNQDFKNENIILEMLNKVTDCPAFNTSNEHSENAQYIVESPELLHRGKIFQTLDNATQIKHPLCKSCYNNLSQSLSSEINNLIKERETQKLCFEEYKSIEPTNFTISSLEEEIKKLSKDNEALLSTHSNLQTQYDDTLAKINELETAIGNTTLREKETLIKMNKQQIELDELQFEYESLQKRCDIDMKHLDYLENCKLLLEIFKIDLLPNKTPKINGLKMGIANEKIDWAEINAGFGEITLLLDIVSNKIGYKSKKFTLNFNGATSSVTHKGEQEETYPLYIKTKLGFGSFVSYKKFNMGLVKLLKYSEVLMDFAKSTQKDIFRIPYKIEDHLIGGVSIMYGAELDSAWSLALNYFLTNLKWLVTVVSDE